ncbi:MAG: hypothetical protein ACK5Y2_04815 [Bdellovibrionales bacterium]
MKIVKLGAILGVLMCGLLGILMTVGWIEDAEALESLKKTLIIIGIITVCMGAITLIGSKSER